MSRKSVLKWSMAGVIAAGSVFAASHLTSRPAIAESKVSSSAMETAHDLSQAFRDIGKKVAPAVVNIQVHKTIPAARPTQGLPQGPMQDPFFRRFFGAPEGDDEGGGFPGFPGFPGQAPFGGGETIGQGSGVIVDVEGKTGYIVTNNHVAGDADEIQVVLNDGRTIEGAKVLGTDPRTDLAVLKIEADDLKAVSWGNSDEIEKGDWVLAFGSPFGYVGSMTHGIVSALNRTDLQIIPQGYEQFIQIDAPINPGNSGGPLVNIHGQIIGINTAIASRSGGFQGIGFAIPSNLAHRITDELRSKGKITRGWLGVAMAKDSEETRQLVRSMGYSSDKGVLVDEVLPNSPASGKLEHGDIVSKVNGKEVADPADMRNRIAMLTPKSEAKLEVFRNGKTLNISVTLGDQPQNLTAAQAGEEQSDQAEEAAPRVGVRLEDLTPDISHRLGMKPDTTGAVILQVEPRSPAAKAGLRRGDVITEVNGVKVANANEAIAAIRQADLHKGIRLYIQTQNTSRFVFVQEKPATEKKK